MGLGLGLGLGLASPPPAALAWAALGLTRLAWEIQGDIRRYREMYGRYREI